METVGETEKETVGNYVTERGQYYVCSKCGALRHIDTTENAAL